MVVVSVVVLVLGWSEFVGGFGLCWGSKWCRVESRSGAVVCIDVVFLFFSAYVCKCMCEWKVRYYKSNGCRSVSARMGRGGTNVE